MARLDDAAVRPSSVTWSLFDLPSVTADPNEPNWGRLPTWAYAVVPPATVTPVSSVRMSVLIVVIVPIIVIITAVIFVIVGIAFFGLCVLYVRGCDRIIRGAEESAETPSEVPQ